MTSNTTVIILSDLFGVVLLSIFITLLIKRSSKLDIERKVKPLFATKCGGQFGGGFFSPPLVRLALYDEFIVISYGHKITIHYDKIDKVIQSKVLWGKLLEIYHRDAAPPFITLSFFSNNDVVEVKKIIESRMIK